jgi:cellulose synthase/poly-beta-1,6-N-acetylglucosamine synthase-like glycosyltransferase
MGFAQVGEAPDEVRGVMRQRSRWCKGHMQVFFSSRCPLFHRKLSPLYWVLYTNGEWRHMQPTRVRCTCIVFRDSSIA